MKPSLPTLAAGCLALADGVLSLLLIVFLCRRFPWRLALLLAVNLAAYARAAEVKAPQTAAPYTLVRCEASTAGDGYAWFVDGPGADDLADVLLDGKRLTFTGPPGRYKVRLVVLAGGKLDQGQAIVTIGAPTPPPPGPGPAPPPPPGPTPTPNPIPTPEVPADEFDNVGRATFQLVRGFPAGAIGKSAETAALYRRIATALETAGELAPGIRAVSPGVASAYLQAERTKLWGPEASIWQAMVDAHQPIITKHKPDKPAYIRFLTAVAVGLEAVK